MQGQRMSEQAPRPGLRLRRGSSADFDPVSALHAAVAAEGTWIGAEAPVEWTPERRQAWCRTADDEQHGAWFLAEDDAAEDDAADSAGGDAARLVGYLAVTRSGREHAEFGMMVAAGHRGRGIGGGLLDAAVAWCRDAAVSKLSCQVWPHNGGALALYRSRGFLVEGRLRRHWRRRNGQLWDAVVMGLVLDQHSPGSGLADAELLRPTGADPTPT
jgi:RimJ/RimL family protein N-acetyltransferase